MDFGPDGRFTKNEFSLLGFSANVQQTKTSEILEVLESVNFMLLALTQKERKKTNLSVNQSQPGSICAVAV
jgi:hypothetical protein